MFAVVGLLRRASVAHGSIRPMSIDFSRLLSTEMPSTIPSFGFLLRLMQTFSASRFMIPCVWRLPKLAIGAR